MSTRPDRDPAEDSSCPDLGAPPPLVVAAGLILIEGILTAMYGVSELVNISSARVVMGLTTALFFLAYGGVLILCSRGLRRVHTWARGPALLTQLIWLGLAWNFRSGGTWPVAVMLAVPAVITLVGMLHPRSVDALNRAP